MKSITCLLLIPLIATLSGCTGIKVSSEHNSSYKFDQISTYQWVDAPAEILDKDDTYLNVNIQKALNNELSARGWSQALEATNASIQAVYYIKLKEHQEYTTSANADQREFSGGFVYNRDKSNWGYEEREPDLNAYTVEVGTLSVLLYDTKTGDRIWRGSVQTKLDRSKSIKKQQQLIRDVSRKLIERVPAGK